MSVYAKTLILAIAQGITEFLPVSSSGHLLLLNRWLGVQTQEFTLLIALHAGTLLSVLFYYRRRIISLAAQLRTSGSEGRRCAALVILGSIPVVVLGTLCGHRIESLAVGPAIISGLLILNGVVLLSLLLPRPAGNPVNPARALLIGAAQAVAVLPGISRSGSTIVAARHLGVKPEEAAEFSLFLYIPAVVGSVVFTCLKEGRNGLGEVSPAVLLAGITVSAIVGYAAICGLVKTLSSGRFWVFGIYCVAVGTTSLFLL